MSNNVVELGVHHTMAPQEVLEVAERTRMEKPLIIYIDTDGEIQTICSEMTVPEALFLVKTVELRLLGVYTDD